MLNVLYFARLRDQLQTDSEKLTLPDNVSTLGELRDFLCQRGENWQRALTAKGIFAAINQEVANDHSVLKGDEEVAFFPPVTGG